MKFLIIDDHPVVRQGVAAVLRQATEGGEVLQAENGAKALALVGEHADIDVVFLDLMLPGPGGLAILDDLGARSPGLPVIMLSSSEEADDVRRALARGALGYVPKSASPATLLAALNLVLAGEIYVPPFAVQEPGARFGGAPSGAHGGLTDRQVEVLRLIAADKANKQIAHELSVSEKTVKAHVTAILRMLNAGNRAEAVRAARTGGMI